MRRSGYGEACAGIKRAAAGLAIMYEDDRGVPKWQEVFNSNRELFGAKRKSGARTMRHAEWGGLRTMRALRVEPVTSG